MALVGAGGRRGSSRRAVAWQFFRPTARPALFGVSALLYAASVTATVVWCASMSAMGEMPMPGGWTMSMAWLPMCGRTWLGAAASFLGMWVVMTVAMMLPSLVPMLWRYRQAVGRTSDNTGDNTGEGSGETRLDRLTALVGAGYFVVWTMFGMAVFPLGAGLAAVELASPIFARAVPVAVGVVVLIAGALQFSAWKARHLGCCRGAPRPGSPLPTGTPARRCDTACASVSTASAVVPA